MNKKLFDLLIHVIKAVQDFFMEKENPGFFDYLTGYRGALAISVIMHHFCFGMPGEPKIFSMVGLNYGVFGFFILSAFLLTYRLFNEFSKTDGSLTQISKVVVKYFIRRFFRIYVPFVLYCTIVKFVSVKVGWPAAYFYSSWTTMVTLGSTGNNHLWTMAPEIKYYFFIPLFTWIIYISGQRWLICWISSAVLTMCIDYGNLFYLSQNDLLLSNGYKFLARFTIFFKGSLLAILYLKCEKHPMILKYNKMPVCNALIGFVMFILYYMGLRCSSPFLIYPMVISENAYPYCWTVFMFLMLLFAPNRFTQVFTTGILTHFGKYSYGVYLMHTYAIVLISERKSITNSYLEKMFFMLILSYIFGKIFYYLIDLPLIKLANKICSRVSQLSPPFTDRNNLL